jgi:predicted ATPase
VSDVAEVVDRMLAASGTLSVAATSQSLLGVRGKHIWTVAPLSGSKGLPVDSVELFVDRARMVRADFTLTDDNEAAVIEICQRLDHIPLAIELAAARVRGMTPSDISRRLDQRLQLLASSDRLAPGRHRTLDGAVRWSYELLDETQQRVFDRCSVFVGPFTIDAAEIIISGRGVDGWEVLDGILALVDKSLVLADETSEVTRYYLLETMRQFGQANLTAGRTDAHYRDRHADYYAGYVLSRRPRLQGSGDRAALDEIEPELENIRVALRCAADDHASARFEALYSALFLLWLGRNRTAEGTAWAMELTGRPDLDPATRIRTLGFAAAVANIHSLALAQQLTDAADKLWAATHAAPPLLALATVNIGAMMQGGTKVAIAGCDRLMALAPAEPDPFIRGEALVRVLAVLATCGALDRLEQVRGELVTLAEELDNQYLRAGEWNSLAPIIHLIDPDHAGEILLRGYELDEALGYHVVQSSTAMFLALHELRSGNNATAARWASRSLQAASDYSPAYVAQTTSVIVATVKRHSPADSAILLGALRAHRARKHQAGTQAEIDAESRYETSLRRQMGADFDALYAKGQALDEAAMISLAFRQLDAIIESSGEEAES